METTTTASRPAFCPVTRAEGNHARQAESRAIKDVHVEIAVERITADVDTFTDWLAGECQGRTNVSSDWSCRVPGRLLTADVAVLLHAALTAADALDEAGCLSAMRALQQRYLVEKDDRLQQLAAEAAAC